MNQPDIEIYLKQSNASEIISWLNNEFSCTGFESLDDDLLEQGGMIKGTVGSEPLIPVVITPKAAGKAFTSIWFQSDKTPWKNDLECAQSFIKQFDREVRCSAATWTEEEVENDEKWWCLKGDEKKLVRWG